MRGNLQLTQVRGELRWHVLAVPEPPRIRDRLRCRVLVGSTAGDPRRRARLRERRPADGRIHSNPHRKTIADRVPKRQRAGDASVRRPGTSCRAGKSARQSVRIGQRGAVATQRPTVAESAGEPAIGAAQRQPRWMAALRQPGGGNSAPSQRQAPAAPRQEYRDIRTGQAQRFGMPGGGSGRQESLRIAPPVVRERPSYNAPRSECAELQRAATAARRATARRRQSAPSYSAPRRAPHQSAPAPRSNGGGGGGAPRGNSGGGGNTAGRGR